MSDFHRFCLRRKRFCNSAEQGLFVWSMKWIRDTDVWMCGKRLYTRRGYDRSQWLIQVGGGVSVLSPHSHTNPAALRPVVWVITDPNSHGMSGVVNPDGRRLAGVKWKYYYRRYWWVFFSGRLLILVPSAKCQVPRIIKHEAWSIKHQIIRFGMSQTEYFNVLLLWSVFSFRTVRFSFSWK